MKFQIWYHVPEKRYDYTEFDSWDEVVNFITKSKESVENGISFEIKRCPV